MDNYHPNRQPAGNGQPPPAPLHPQYASQVQQAQPYAAHQQALGPTLMDYLMGYNIQPAGYVQIEINDLHRILAMYQACQDYLTQQQQYGGPLPDLHQFQHLLQPNVQADQVPHNLLQNEAHLAQPVQHAHPHQLPHDQPQPAAKQRQILPVDREKRRRMKKMLRRKRAEAAAQAQEVAQQAKRRREQTMQQDTSLFESVEKHLEAVKEGVNIMNDQHKKQKETIDDLKKRLKAANRKIASFRI